MLKSVQEAFPRGAIENCQIQYKVVRERQQRKPIYVAPLVKVLDKFPNETFKILVRQLRSIHMLPKHYKIRVVTGLYKIEVVGR